NDLEKLINEVKTNFPADEKGFREFLEKCFEITQGLHEGKEFPEFNNIGFTDFLGKFVKSDYIKDAFNLFSMWYGVPPHELPVTTGASIVYMIINIGVYYPKGGMQAFSDRLAEFYKKNGGEIYFNKMVVKILVENGKTIGVQLEDGTIIKSKWIISNADAKRTILQYTGKEHFPVEFVEFMNDLKVSPTGFMLHLGVDMDLSSYPSHFQIGKDLDIIKKVREDKFTMEKLAVRIPANIEPALCNKGKYGLVAFIFAPYNWENYWRAGEEKIRGEEYKKLKDEIADEAISIIEKVIPNIREKIEVKELATPLTFERYLQVTDGAWFGSLSFRKKPDMQTPISNLLLVGASVKGSGAPSALRHGIEVGKYLLEKIME
ncbi:MAG: NAD(P)/FAD-dependent oxidoreductase, partial [Candidatus Heimdallarchaeota archaeon]|nr:NAD(P)/FAD-dependent oxidoreductase [Candidatus Heimdallarchaeota archaeon]